MKTKFTDLYHLYHKAETALYVKKMNTVIPENKDTVTSEDLMAHEDALLVDPKYHDQAFEKAIKKFMSQYQDRSTEVKNALLSRDIPPSLESLIKEAFLRKLNREKESELKRLYNLQEPDPDQDVLDPQEIEKKLSKDHLTQYNQNVERLTKELDYDHLSNCTKENIFNALMKQLQPQIIKDPEYAVVLKQYENDNVRIRAIENQKWVIFKILDDKTFSYSFDDFDKNDYKPRRLCKLAEQLINTPVKPNTASDELVKTINVWRGKVYNGKSNQEVFTAPGWSRFFPCVPHESDTFIKKCLKAAQTTFSDEDMTNIIIMGKRP
ncbi:MAG: hypothetical protein EPN84_07700 [Legionella sp.]|nr:MAG: hypothetical protein EPN84_07700 [Legionella sp.]